MLTSKPRGFDCADTHMYKIILNLGSWIKEGSPHEIVSFEPEGCYHYIQQFSVMNLKGASLSLYKVYAMVIAPFWFWTDPTEGCWIVLMPFLFSADKIIVRLLCSELCS